MEWVAFHPGTMPGAFDAAHRRGHCERNAAFARRLVLIGEADGAGIALEYCPDKPAGGDQPRRQYGAIPVELIELIDALDQPLAGVCWDTGHGGVQGLDQGAALRALGTRLKVTHVHDNDGRSDQHSLPCSGKMAWHRLMDTIAAIDYVGPFSLEVHNSFRNAPDNLKDAELRYAYRVAESLVEQAEHAQTP